MALIQLKNICKSYQTTPELPERKVLDHINLEIRQGDSMAITGPSGSGKSTLLNIIGSMDIADSGSVWFKDENISSFSPDQRSDFRNKHIGFVFQQHHLLPQLTLMENVLLPLLEEKDKQKKKNAFDRARDLLSWTGLAEHTEKFPWQLSGGELQRGAVVRSLINEPEVILADEPTGSLDEENAHSLVDLLLKINEEKNIALVMVTHAAKLAEKMDQKYFLSQASLVEIK